jgi:hypothetical protein
MRTSRIISLLILAGALVAGSPAGAQEREWLVAPYLWGADTSLDVLIRDESALGGDLSFSDLVDKLDFALQLRVETRKDTFGLIFDLTYLDTGDSFESEADPPLPASATISTDATMTMIEAAGFYRPSGESYGLDVLFGARVIDLGVDTEIVPPAPLDPITVDASASLLDGFLGLRYIAPIGKNWVFTLRGDAGAGDSDLSWNASALFGYRFGENGKYNVLLGYRHFSVEYEESDQGLPIEVDVTMSGPQVAFAFVF